MDGDVRRVMPVWKAVPAVTRLWRLVAAAAAMTAVMGVQVVIGYCMLQGVSGAEGDVQRRLLVLLTGSAAGSVVTLVVTVAAGVGAYQHQRADARWAGAFTLALLHLSAAVLVTAVPYASGSATAVTGLVPVTISGVTLLMVLCVRDAGRRHHRALVMPRSWTGPV